VESAANESVTAHATGRKEESESDSDGEDVVGGSIWTAEYMVDEEEEEEAKIKGPSRKIRGGELSLTHLQCVTETGIVLGLNRC
jgi:hypothetical protein